MAPMEFLCRPSRSGCPTTASTSSLVTLPCLAAMSRATVRALFSQPEPWNVTRAMPSCFRRCPSPRSKSVGCWFMAHHPFQSVRPPRMPKAIPRAMKERAMAHSTSQFMFPSLPEPCARLLGACTAPRTQGTSAPHLLAPSHGCGRGSRGRLRLHGGNRRPVAWRAPGLSGHGTVGASWATPSLSTKLYIYASIDTLQKYHRLLRPQSGVQPGQAVVLCFPRPRMEKPIPSHTISRAIGGHAQALVPGLLKYVRRPCCHGFPSLLSPPQPLSWASG